MVAEQVEREGQRDGGRLVAGQQEDQDLVADLVVVEPAPPSSRAATMQAEEVPAGPAAGAPLRDSSRRTRRARRLGAVGAAVGATVAARARADRAVGAQPRQSADRQVAGEAISHDGERALHVRCAATAAGRRPERDATTFLGRAVDDAVTSPERRPCSAAPPRPPPPSPEGSRDPLPVTHAAMKRCNSSARPGSEQPVPPSQPQPTSCQQTTVLAEAVGLGRHRV